MKSTLLISKYNWDAPVEIPYLFYKAGYKVSIYCPANSWLTHSSFYHEHFNASNTDDLFISGLASLIERNQFDWIQLVEDPLIDFIKRKVSDTSLLLQLLPIKNPKAFDILSSKIGFSSYFFQQKIATPQFRKFINGFDSIDQLSDLQFPVLNKYDLSWGGTDISISNSLEELSVKLKSIPQQATLLIQEFIDGEEIRIDALFYKGQLLNLFCAKVLAYTKDRFSYTTRRAYYDYSAINEILSHIGELIGANGFANISFIRDNKTGIHYLIEIDMRPNSWMAYSQYLSKYDFVYCLRHLDNPLKLDIPKGKLKRLGTIELALFYKDIRRAVWAKDFKGIGRWFLGYSGYWKFLPFYDLRLTKKIFSEIWNEIGVFKLKQLRKKSNFSSRCIAFLIFLGNC
jgi:hypothetical protein